MSVVAEDRQGIYLLLDGRVGRPGPGQGAGLAKGRHVRASVQGGAMRVRWAAKEESWPLYASRRAPVAAGVGAAPGQVPYRAGQVWWREGVSNTVTVRSVESDGIMVTAGGGRYSSEGVNLSYQSSASRRVTRLLYDPTLPAPRHTYAVGQVWQRLDGTLVRVTEVRVHPDDSNFTARFEDGWRRADGAYSSQPLGSNQRDAVLLVQDVEPAPAPPAVAAPPVPAAQPAPARGKVPTGAPLKPDGTVDWRMGQQWRLRNGEVVAVEDLDASDNRYPVRLGGEWCTPSGWINHSREDDPDGEEDDADVLTYVGSGAAATAPAAANNFTYVVGQRYRTRNGSTATIVQVGGDALADNDFFYNAAGVVFDHEQHDQDLMELLPAEGVAELQPGKPLPVVIPYVVGQKFRTRGGDVRTVITVDSSDIPACMENHYWYKPDGTVFSEDLRNLDLVEFVAHPA